MRRVGVHETTAVGPEHLDGDLRCDWPLRDALLLHRLILQHDVPGGVLHRVVGGVDLGYLDGLRLRQLRAVVGLEVLRHPLGNQHRRVHDAQRQQHVIMDAHQVDPEVAHRLRLVPRDSAHQRCRHGDADRRRPEVVAGQRHHLREIAHGVLTRVRLPVGVRGEAGRRVESKVRRHRRLVRQPVNDAMERQVILQSQERVGKEHRHQAEQQHGHGVASPALFPARIDPQ